MASSMPSELRLVPEADFGRKRPIEAHGCQRGSEIIRMDLRFSSDHADLSNFTVCQRLVWECPFLITNR